METVFKIAGIPVGPLARGQSLSWEQSYGVDPVSRIYSLPEDVVARIRAQNSVFPTEDTEGTRQAGSLTLSERRRELPSGGVTLEVGGLLFERLRALKPVSDTQPGYQLVEIVDSRWWLRYTHVERSYNVRKRGPRRRLVGTGGLQNVVPGQSLAGVTNVADIIYRRETLDGEVPWTASRILEDVLEELVGTGNFEIDDFPFEDTPYDLELNADGRTALLQVLAYLPGVRIFCRRDGKLHATYALDSTYLFSFLEGVNDVKEDGAWSVIDRSDERPASYKVLFDRKVEVRFDAGRYDSTSITSGTATRTRTTEQPGREEPAIENVVENPFITLTLPDGTISSKGEYIKYEDILRAAAQRDDIPSTAVPNLNDTTIRRFITGKWSQYSLLFKDLNINAPAEEWANFVKNIRRDYRTLYRLTPRWQDKVRTIEANLVATVDQENAVRAKSPVFTQFITKLAYYVLPGGEPGKAKSQKGGFNTDNWALDLDVKNRSPFDVVVVDAEQGIFRLVANRPPDGHVDKYQIGKTPEALIPDVGVLDGQGLWGNVILDADYKTAVILTVTPSVPNGIGRLKAIDVSVPEAAAKLGIPAQPGAAGIHEVYTDLRQAKYAWRDGATGEAIKKMVWEGEETSIVVAASLANEPDLRDIAAAVAARELELKLDLPFGDITAPLQDIEPVGTLSRVIHTVSSGRSAGGRVTTRMIMEDPQPVRNPLGFLSQTTRDKIRRAPTND